MKEFRNRFIPFKGFKAINIFGLLFIRGNAEMRSTDINHERIHTAQMKELLYLPYLPFYIIYAFEWLFNMIKGKKPLQAYHAISFEREAYQNERNLDYLSHRIPYAQWRLLGQ